MSVSLMLARAQELVHRVGARVGKSERDLAPDDWKRAVLIALDSWQSVEQRERAVLRIFDPSEPA